MAAFPSWNQRTFVWNTSIPDDGSYENFIGGIASQPKKLNNVSEVNQSIGDILEYFDNDSTRFAVFLSRFLDKNYDTYYVPTPEEKAKEAERAKGGPKISVTTDGKTKEVATVSELANAQKMRRRASQALVSAHLASETGRRLSSLEKGNFVVEKAKELANQEQEEDAKLGADEEVEDEPEKNENWKYLPYEPVSGDSVDELLAEQLNVFEIDVSIRPLQLKKKKRKGRGKDKSKKSNKIFYRIQGKKKRVRCIHGVLLVRENNKWIELIPHLRKLAGMPALDKESAIKKLTKSKKGKK